MLVESNWVAERAERVKVWDEHLALEQVAEMEPRPTETYTASYAVE